MKGNDIYDKEVLRRINDEINTMSPLWRDFVVHCNPKLKLWKIREEYIDYRYDSVKSIVVEEKEEDQLRQEDFFTFNKDDS